MVGMLILLLGSHIGALGRSLHRYFVISPFSLGTQLVMAQKFNYGKLIGSVIYLSMFNFQICIKW